MPYRNVLSLARRLAAISLGVAVITLAAPAAAGESTDDSSFLSLSPALRPIPETTASGPSTPPAR